MKEREVSGAQKQEEGPVGTKPSLKSESSLLSLPSVLWGLRELSGISGTQKSKQRLQGGALEPSGELVTVNSGMCAQALSRRSPP